MKNKQRKFGKIIKVTDETWGKDLTLLGGPLDGTELFVPEDCDLLDKEGHQYSRTKVVIRLSGEPFEIPVFVYIKDGFVVQVQNCQKYAIKYMNKLAKDAGISNLKVRDRHTGKETTFNEEGEIFK